MSHREIARRMNMSAKVVSNFLRDPDAYGTRYKPGRDRALTERGRRRLFGEARKTGSFAKTLQNSLQLDASVRTTQRELHNNDVFEYVKRNHTPRMTPEHKKKRIEWAKTMLNERTDCSSIIFSDEKKFNLGGPYGLQKYCHHLRDEKQSFFSRHSGGDSVMVWGCFSSRGLEDLAFVSGRQSSETYCDTLGNHLMLFAHQHHVEKMQFQQDEASCRRARDTIVFLKEQGVTVVEHPALSPGFNPIEDLWVVLTHAVYRDGRQFMSKNDLKSVILSEWKIIGLDYLQKLVDSMPDRCFEVVERKGAKTSF
uniref:Protein ZK218.2 putative n=1 Tax=Albugo laibachii Nc14 TaxID=890382 RepID=F0WRE2_9STRA|nr:protein ZK218.2 putative [Albugo laibachii Nc14]|eukprot:CCA23905.1 protein ZK218.2 putative [Albugo laibachii Nc14]